MDKFYFCGGNQPYGSVGYNGFEVLVDFKYPYILRDHPFKTSACPRGGGFKNFPNLPTDSTKKLPTVRG